MSDKDIREMRLEVERGDRLTAEGTLRDFLDRYQGAENALFERDVVPLKNFADEEWKHLEEFQRDSPDRKSGTGEDYSEAVYLFYSAVSARDEIEYRRAVHLIGGVVRKMNLDLGRMRAERAMARALDPRVVIDHFEESFPEWP